MDKPKFELGELVMTQGIAHSAVFEGTTVEQIVASLVARHNSGDWGDIDNEDKATNEAGLKHGERLMSAYDDVFDGETVWVITERDRSVTTVLLPSEY